MQARTIRLKSDRAAEAWLTTFNADTGQKDEV
jgi:hypothetical protein